MPPAPTGGEIHPTLVIGLTGGMGSGKSTVAALFEQLNIPVIDADGLARALVAPGQPALQEIIAAFGPASVDADGNLDRDHLRELVFSDSVARHQLEAILHPRIRHEIITWISHIQTPYCVVVIPLLLETGQRDLVDRVLVVDSPLELQIERVMQRSGLSRRDVDAIIAAQAARESRLAAADEVINNDGPLDALEARVRILHERYLRLARNRYGSSQICARPPPGRK
jgi:dephospho-CoA kinase